MTATYRRPPKTLTFLVMVAIAFLAAILFTQWLGGDRSPWVTPLGRSPQAGGLTTVNNRTSKAFGLPATGLSPGEMDLHAVGDVAFDAVFVTAPAEINPGLGPLFNNSSCSGCHIGNGRGLPELGNALVRVSLPVSNDVEVAPHEGVVPVPNLGTQIRDNSVYGQLADAEVELNWLEEAGQYPDGTSYSLRQPQLTIKQADPAKPIPANLETSLRTPPAVFGTGLLEAIPEKTLKKLADANDRNQDGISGRINRVWNPETQTLEVGRFGLKANSPNLRHQTASAYANDMGISNPLFPDAGGQQDIGDQTLRANTFYNQSLGVPARNQLDNPVVQTGEKLFANANCAACHISTIKTGASSIKALAHQTIHPYTDLLLHDMGQGLADQRSDFEADGQEWRTSPLWGLGLVQTVLPYAGYLHDGRARTVEEAILWHGGEAEQSRAQFLAMKAEDREALLTFLNSL
jgi:CxxC motif-containing protein (DUF1111 family)